MITFYTPLLPALTVSYLSAYTHGKNDIPSTCVHLNPVASLSLAPYSKGTVFPLSSYMNPNTILKPFQNPSGKIHMEKKNSQRAKSTSPNICREEGNTDWQVSPQQDTWEFKLDASPLLSVSSGQATLRCSVFQLVPEQCVVYLAPLYSNPLLNFSVLL